MDPRNVAGQIGERLAAVGRVERHLGIDVRRDPKQSPRRIDDFALRGDAAARQIDNLRTGQIGAFGAGSFEAAHALDHQRRDRQQGDHDQPAADAEDGLLTPQL